jgi:hypothetical protein
METVLTDYGQIILLLGVVWAAAGYLVENVALWGVGLRAVPVCLRCPGGAWKQAGWSEWRSLGCPAPLERCSLTKRYIFRL